MPRYKITIEYDGTGLAGWQKQHHQYSVQAALENALFGLSAEETRVFCSGRTDAGVHALAQAVHFDLSKEWDLFRLTEGLNFYLRQDEKFTIPMQVAVIKAESVADDFHARFSAKKRYYEYKIINRHGHLALEQSRAWCVHEKLDIAKMQEAAKILVGRHDFTSFRSSACQAKNPVRTLDSLDISAVDNIIKINCHAQSFLHHMVRNMVGSLKLVGTGKWSVADMQKALDAADRRAAGPTAPPQGLYFVKVEY